MPAPGGAPSPKQTTNQPNQPRAARERSQADPPQTRRARRPHPKARAPGPPSHPSRGLNSPSAVQGYPLGAPLSIRFPRFVRPYLPASHAHPVPPSFRSGPGIPTTVKIDGGRSFSHPSIPLSPVECVIAAYAGALVSLKPSPRESPSPSHRPRTRPRPQTCDQIPCCSRAPLGARSCCLVLPQVPWGPAAPRRRRYDVHFDNGAILG